VGHQKKEKGGRAKEARRRARHTLSDKRSTNKGAAKELGRPRTVHGRMKKRGESESPGPRNKEGAARCELREEIREQREAKTRGPKLGEHKSLLVRREMKEMPTFSFLPTKGNRTKKKNQGAELIED